MRADFALITADAHILSRAVRAGSPHCWQLGEQRLAMLPLHCRAGEKALSRALRQAWQSGCLLAAMPPKQHYGLRYAPLPLANGQMLGLSLLPGLLDKNTPEWRGCMQSFCADDDFACLAARWLAPYCARLYIYGQNEVRRQALARLLYNESGLIALSGHEPPESSGPDWRRLPRLAAFREGYSIDCHVAEALLLSAGGLPVQKKPLLRLRLLRHRSLYYGVSII